MKQQEEENLDLVIGCNYHTKWQSNKAMRFVLSEIIDSENVILKTRTTNKTIKAKTADLIFIQTTYNKKKSKRLLLEGRMLNNTNSLYEIIMEGKELLNKQFNMKQQAEETAQRMYERHGKDEAITICFATKELLKEWIAEKPNYRWLEEKYNLFELVMQYLKTYK